MAKGGEPTALRLCIERLLPRAKPDVGINFQLPEGGIDTGDNMLQITNDLTNAVASGQMTLLKRRINSLGSWDISAE